MLASSAAASLSQTYNRDDDLLTEGPSLTGIRGDAGGNTQTFSYHGLNRLTASGGLTRASIGSVRNHATRASIGSGAAHNCTRYGQPPTLMSTAHGPRGLEG